MATPGGWSCRRSVSGLPFRLGRQVVGDAFHCQEDVVGHFPDRLLVREQAGVPLGLPAAELGSAVAPAGELCPGEREHVVRALVQPDDGGQVFLVAQRPAVLEQDFVDGVVVGPVEPAHRERVLDLLVVLAAVWKGRDAADPARLGAPWLFASNARELGALVDNRDGAGAIVGQPLRQNRCGEEAVGSFLNASSGLACFDHRHCLVLVILEGLLNALHQLRIAAVLLHREQPVYPLSVEEIDELLPGVKGVGVEDYLAGAQADAPEHPGE